MAQPKRKAINKMISLYDPHLNIVDHFMEDKGMTSTSDVIRQALVFMHDKMYPNYIFSLSPAAKLKQRQLSRLEDFEVISDEDFAISKGLDVFTAEDGTQLVLYRGLGHMAYLIPLQGIKEWAESNEYDIDYTWQDKKIEANEQFFERSYIKKLLSDNNILNISNIKNDSNTPLEVSS